MAATDILALIGGYDPLSGEEPLHQPVTASFDIRYSGYKIVPVDANLFPAGWHQLCSGAVELATRNLRRWADAHRIEGGILLYVEPFTRNPSYLESIHMLAGIAANVFPRMEVVMPLPALPDDGHVFQTVRGPLKVFRFDRPADHIARFSDGEPAAGIFLNSDLSDGSDILERCRTPIFPAPVHGWHQRRKEQFFRHWQQVAEAIAKEHGFEPWRLIPETESLEIEDFRAEQEKVADAVADMLQRIAAAYREHGINDRPFVVIKDASGTFGRGVLMLSDAAELAQLPAKTLKGLHRGQRGRQVRNFLLQEGVYTREMVRDCPSEPVVYVMGGAVTGGFYRSHCGRDPATSLNAPGMVFASMCLPGEGPHPPEKCHADPSSQHAYYQVGQWALNALDLEVRAAES